MKSSILPILLLAALVYLTGCGDQETTPDGSLDQYGSTYAIIQGEIWDRHCTTCHVAGSSFARQSGLVLTPDVSYDQLVGRLPTNVHAREEGLELVGNQGLESLYQSFLWEKINAPDIEHLYDDHPEYGSIMPLGGESLTNGQLAFIREWIVSGAPREGFVADVQLLEDESRYEPVPFEVLEPPAQGYQFHVGPFEVKTNQDRELFTYQPLHNDSAVYIKEIEIVMRPGSHHFILYRFPEDYPESLLPKEGFIRDVYYPDGSYNEITLFYMQFHQFVAGTQWPRLHYRFPEGVALQVPAGSGFDLNSHYANKSEEMITGEVYANIHTVNADEVAHAAEILQLNNLDFVLPAGQVTTLERSYSFDREIQVFQLFSHAHSHMTEFRVYLQGGDRDGELVYIAYDWEHPPILQLDPPLTLGPGQGLRLAATYDNDEDRDIRFGLRSTDEMMILFGAYYE